MECLTSKYAAMKLLSFYIHPRLFHCRHITTSQYKPQKVGKIFSYWMNIIRRSIHGADRENHLSKSTNETEVDTIYPCPSKNRCTFWGTKIICIILTEFNSHRT